MSGSLFIEFTPNILVVDDDEIIRILLRQFLEGEGYKVSEAEDGFIALEKLSQATFDLIILDIAMPGMDGPNVCEFILASLPSPPPVLMITALDDEVTINRSFDAGAVDFIRKPLRWPVLKNRIRYIIGSYRAKVELEILSSNYEMILDAAANGICGVDEKQLINYVNPAGLKMLGYTSEEVTGYPYTDIFKVSIPGSDDFSKDCCPFFTDPNNHSSTHYDEARLLRKDGTNFPADFRTTPIIQDGRSVGGVLVFQDITEEQQAAELIRYMANHDSLTNLPNRNYFRRRLSQAISLAKRHTRMLSLLFVDLDRFKPINDTYGHNIGDIVLTKVAERLKKMLRKSDSVCRLGGDEFVILLESTETVEGAGHVAQKTIESLNEPIEANEHICHIGASIGVAVFPNDCEDAESMLKHADIAMYEAKKKGRNCWQIYKQM